MTTGWDSAALTHLEAAAAGWRDIGLLGEVERCVAYVWRRNQDAFDPSEGDTALSIGMACSENIRELLSREAAGPNSPLGRRGVTPSSVNGSLTLTAQGRRLAVMKAPPAPGRRPDWQSPAFSWDSEVRAAAAARNTAAYQPPVSDQPGRQLGLDLHAGGGPCDVAGLMDLLLVWAGDLDSGLTAGWLTLPTTGDLPFLAATPVWWHDPDSQPGQQPGQMSPPAGPEGDTYIDRPRPEAALTLRQAPAAQARPDRQP